LAFETRNYAVKIYSQENRLLMDVYNKKIANFMLVGTPVRVTYSSTGSGYWYRNQFTFRIFERADGRKWLTINQYGQAMDEIWEGQ